MTRATRDRLLIAATLAGAMTLTILPLPNWADAYRPQWVALVLIFWCLTRPRQVGVFWAFGIGLLQDVVSGAVLGENALTLAVVAFLAIELHPRILPFPPWQQTLSVWLLLVVERLLSLWILGATGQPTPTLSYWLPTFVSAMLWPALSALLRKIE